MAAHGSKLVIFAALGGNALIAVTKFGAAWYTGSAAMLSEAIHSMVDTGNQILLLHGMRQAAKPPTPTHPFGHGLRLYFWAFVVAVLIFGLGAGLSILEGLEKIETPHAVTDAYVNYVVLGLGILFESSVWLIAFKEFRKSKGNRSLLGAVHGSKDPTVFTVLFEDTAAVLGLTVAFLGIALGQALDLPVLDGVASLIIGAILAVTAGFLAYECQSLLTGEGVDPMVRDSIRRIALAEAGVVGVNELLTMHFGPRDVLVTLSLDFEDSLLAGRVETIVSGMEERIKAAHPEVTRVFIEAQSFAAHRRAVRSAAG
ncbi:cation diffusion facilitator family transporter [Telmatospirillum siberiense]|uniref:Cation transporter n=1 Tax=Telmatospirillum siberiense TaxID=382514 RepID=A0A2N3PSU4_9PROT|nr:cation diffusion facilitator family transporter [Telmatospirillum siberiense]PKU23481.1 cation transporter [Telmatospirillum siberiense]